MHYCFEERTFSRDFFFCVSCISLGQYLQINVQKYGVWKKGYKEWGDRVGVSLSKRGAQSFCAL